MFMYWLFFVCIALLSLFERPRSSEYTDITIRSIRLKSLTWFDLSFFVLTLFIGLRHEVGGDWARYLTHFERAKYLSYYDVLQKKDSGYQVLNWLVSHCGGDIYIVNTICAAFFSCGLIAICRHQPRPWLALLIAVPYMIIVVAMGYTRQSAALGFFMLGLGVIPQGRIYCYFLLLIIAGLFHKSALVTLPLVLLNKGRNPLLTLLILLPVSAVLFKILVSDSIDAESETYIESGMDSSGALIRVLMNAVPAFIFLVFRRRFVMTETLNRFLMWMAVISLGFVGLYLISPSSTVVDRLALYCMPVQIIVLSRFPDAMGFIGFKSFWTLSVIVYGAMTLLVWLFFASHAFAWLPYRFYPWVMLWS